MKQAEANQMSRMQEDPSAHLIDIDVLLDAPYDEKPGESFVDAPGDTDLIEEFEITQEDLTGTKDDDENWLIFGGSYEGQRRFPGDGITHDNVEDLEVEYQINFSDDYDVGDGQGTPLLVQGDPPIMYRTFGPDHLFALNARTGEVLWSHNYEGAINVSLGGAPAERGPALIGDLVIKSTLDYGVLALNRYTGEEEWYFNGACVIREEPAEDGPIHEEYDWNKSGPCSSYPPLIYEGTIMKGSFGAEFGGTHGFFDGIDLDGQPKWRVNMTPEDEWVGETWHHAGACTWASGCVDPENDQVITAVGNAGPWYGTARPGWNVYASGKAAFDTETGEYRWHYQSAPHEWWDYDDSSPPIVYSAEVDGEERRLSSWAPKTGWVHTVDNESGKLVQRSDGYVQHVNMWELPPRGDTSRASWFIPSAGGGTNPQPSSYHEESQTMIVTGGQAPQRFAWNPTEWSPGGFYLGVSLGSTTDPDDVPEWNGYGGVTAGLDPVTGEIKWRDWRDLGNRGSSVTTATGISFVGTGEGEFIAYDTETGDNLWSDDLDASIGGLGTGSGSRGLRGGPMIWNDPSEGKHYVAVSSDAGNESVLTVYSLEA